MIRISLALLFFTICSSLCFAQAGRAKVYSDGIVRNAGVIKKKSVVDADKSSGEVVRVETDLMTIPVRVTTKGGRSVTDIKRTEFKILENGAEQEIAYFSDIDQPFTVALVLDMSYSSVFKLEDIQHAARQFVSLLRPEDKVLVVSFDEKPTVLCEFTNDRRILDLAIKGSRIGSGTSLYLTLDMILKQKFGRVDGRKAIVLLSDGVDTSSKFENSKTILDFLTESDVMVYPIRYDTFDDVQESRRVTAPIQYDEDDQQYRVDLGPKKGERKEDYDAAKEFLGEAASVSGGRIFTANSKTNLDSAFAEIAKELRKIYTIGYYPNRETDSGTFYDIKVRVYRPDLTVRVRESGKRR